MSVLIVIWLSSLLVMGAILGFAHYIVRRRATATENLPQTMSELLRRETLALAELVRRGFALFRPHAKHAAISAIVVFRRSQDKFIERVFGHIEIERGEAV